MKRWIAMLLALLTVLLCGCGAETDPVETTVKLPEQTSAPVETTVPQETAAPDLMLVELTAWVTFEDIWADKDALKAMLEEFNAYYPNILVTVEHRTPDQVGGEKPDIILGNTDDLSRWAADGSLVDMTALWENLEGEIYATAEARCGEEEARFAVPMCVIPYCMAINTSYFERAQAMSLLNMANHTWSTANFLQACENLSDAGLDEALNVYCRNTEDDVYTRLLVENLYGAAYVNTINGSYKVESAQMGNALKALQNGRGIAIAPDLDGADSLEKFLSGESAMTLNWSAALQLEHRENEDIFFMLYPANGKTKTYVDVYGLGVFDNGDATKLAASMTFVSHVSKSDAAVRATGQLPARKSAKNAYAGTELDSVMDDLSGLLNYMVEGEIPGQRWEDGRKLWVKLLQDVLVSEDINLLLQECQTELDILLGIVSE